MKKNDVIAGGAAALVVIGASVLAYKQIRKKRNLKHAAAVVSEIQVISIDYPSYATLEEVFKESDIVVKGQIIDTEIKEIKVGSYDDGKAMFRLHTVSKVKVLKAIKGSVKEGDIIFVIQLGDGEKVIAHGFEADKYFKKWQGHYLFLKSSNKESPEVTYSCLNPHQGSYEIVSDKIAEGDMKAAGYTSIAEKNYAEGISSAEFQGELESYKSKY